jgi:hypothetical protein
MSDPDLAAMPTGIIYHPGPVPYDVKELPRYIETELMKLHSVIARIAEEKQDAE